MVDILFHMWILFAVGASLFWGLTYVFNERVYEKISVLTSLGITSLVVAIITILLSLIFGTLKSDVTLLMSSKPLLWYFICGIIALLVAEIFIGFSITAKSATLAGLVEISYPIFIALFSYFFFKQGVSIPTILGGVVIFIGIFIIYFFNK